MATAFDHVPNHEAKNNTGLAGANVLVRLRLCPPTTITTVAAGNLHRFLCRCSAEATEQRLLGGEGHHRRLQ